MNNAIIAESPPTVKRGRGRPPLLPEDIMEATLLKFRKDRKEDYKAAAKSSGLTLAAWVRKTLDRAAQELAIRKEAERFYAARNPGADE